MNTLVDESVAFGLNTFMHAPLVYQVSLFREIVENGKHVSRKEHMVQKRPQIHDRICKTLRIATNNPNDEGCISVVRSALHDP